MARGIVTSENDSIAESVSYEIFIKAGNVLGFEEAIKMAAAKSENSLFGICLGMQLLAEMSTESGSSRGMALISGNVTRFSLSEGARYVQNVGFNTIAWTKDSILRAGIPDSAPFYFTHSYKLAPDNTQQMAASSHNGSAFVSVIDNGKNIFGTQFHPEKSQKHGLQLLRNYVFHD
jgi:glutamine amidotransferase